MPLFILLPFVLWHFLLSLQQIWIVYSLHIQYVYIYVSPVSHVWNKLLVLHMHNHCLREKLLQNIKILFSNTVLSYRDKSLNPFGNSCGLKTGMVSPFLLSPGEKEGSPWQPCKDFPPENKISKRVVLYWAKLETGILSWALLKLK